VDVEIVLPCLDEAAALPAVLATLPDWPVLVVDNGSTDDTAAVARAWGARVVVEPRRGYGAAVHTGMWHARAELVAVLDGDGSLDAAALPTLADGEIGPSAPHRVGERRQGRGVE
jgi:glycosyltransferase involved in cell wall biosynthesis